MSGRHADKQHRFERQPPHPSEGTQQRDHLHEEECGSDRSYDQPEHGIHGKPRPKVAAEKHSHANQRPDCADHAGRQTTPENLASIIHLLSEEWRRPDGPFDLPPSGFSLSPRSAVLPVGLENIRRGQVEYVREQE